MYPSVSLAVYPPTYLSVYLSTYRLPSPPFSSSILPSLFRPVTPPHPGNSDWPHHKTGWLLSYPLLDILFLPSLPILPFFLPFSSEYGLFYFLESHLISILPGLAKLWSASLFPSFLLIIHCPPIFPFLPFNSFFSFLSLLMHRFPFTSYFLDSFCSPSLSMLSSSFLSFHSSPFPFPSF